MTVLEVTHFDQIVALKWGKEWAEANLFFQELKESGPIIGSLFIYAPATLYEPVLPPTINVPAIDATATVSEPEQVFLGDGVWTPLLDAAPLMFAPDPTLALGMNPIAAGATVFSPAMLIAIGAPLLNVAASMLTPLVTTYTPYAATLGASDRESIAAIRDGSVVGMSVLLTEAPTSGEARVSVTVNGVKTLTLTIDSGTEVHVTEAKDVYPFSAGDEIGVIANVESNPNPWSPVSSDLTVMVEVQA